MGRGGIIYVVSGTAMRWTTSDNLAEVGKNFAAGNYFSSSTTAQRNRAANYAGFRREVDFMADAELACDPLIRDVLRPAGFGYGAGSVIDARTGDKIVVNIQREHRRGPMPVRGIAALDSMRPHLARSLLTSARLQLERAEAATRSLELLGLPALVFDEKGKVIAANSSIEALAGEIHWRAHGRVTLADRSADALFQEAIQRLDQPAPSSPRSFAIRGIEGNCGMIAHVIPIRRSARDIFAMSAGMLMLTKVSYAEAPPVELVQSLFDLTPAEAHVARDLTSGLSVDQIAQGNGLSPATIRTHVRGVLEKMGCTRQAEVVSLLGGITAPVTSTDSHQ